MRVIHIGFKYGVNNTGGAAIAASRLHRALLANGVESHYVCIWKREEGVNVHELPVGWRRVLFLKLTKLLRGIWKLSPHRRSIPLNLVPLFGLKNLLTRINPDVVHIHWINADVAGLEQLGNLRKLVKPSCKIVFNLHDLYVLLPGIEAYPKTSRYIEGVDRTNATWIERWLFARRKRMIGKTSPLFIGPSEWVCACCRKSIVGRGHPAYAVLNIIDPVFTFHPEMCVPHDTFVILFGCFGGRTNRLKSWSDLASALEQVPPEIACKTEVRVFGETGPDESINGIPVKVIGNVSDPKRMLEIYHQADVFAFPSLQETQGMTKIEALLCGCPVVAFDRTACAEGIVSGRNGYIAPDGDIAAFAQGLVQARAFTIADRTRIAAAAAETFGPAGILNAYRDALTS